MKKANKQTHLDPRALISFNLGEQFPWTLATDRHSEELLIKITYTTYNISRLLFLFFVFVLPSLMFSLPVITQDSYLFLIYFLCCSKNKKNILDFAFVGAVKRYKRLSA